MANGFRDGDEESTAVDTGDLDTTFPDHEAASVELFLEADGIAAEEPVKLGFVSGVEELAADAAVLAVGGAGAVGLRGLPGGAVAFRGLLADELIVDLVRLG